MGPVQMQPLHTVQPPAYILENSGGQPRSMGSLYPCGGPGFRLTHLAIAAIWEAKQQTEHLSLSLGNPDFQVK